MTKEQIMYFLKSGMKAVAIGEYKRIVGCTKEEATAVVEKIHEQHWPKKEKEMVAKRINFLQRVKRNSVE